MRSVLGETKIIASVGSKSDSYDCTCRIVNGFYKTESIRRKGLWCNVEHVEWAALNDVDLFNHRRIHESLDYVSSVEFEVHYYGSNEPERR